MAMRRLIQGINEILIIIISFLALMVSTEISSSVNEMPLICTNADNILPDNITDVTKIFTELNNCPDVIQKIENQSLYQ